MDAWTGLAFKNLPPTPSMRLHYVAIFPARLQKRGGVNPQQIESWLAICKSR